MRIAPWLLLATGFRIDGIRFDATRAIANFDVMRELSEPGIAQV